MNYAKYSDRVARLYRAIEDELLVSLARRFATTAERTTGTFNYEAALLARMGAVRKDTARIIAGMVREGEPMIEEAVKGAMLDAVKAEEPQLLGAVRAGMLEGAEITVDESVNIRLANYINQAKDKLNLVNTTMLESTARAYRAGVAAFQAAQDALDREAAALIIGAKDGRSAIRSAVRAMLDSGIDGFVDRRGRHWSAEGYAAMVINTTSGSAATQAALDFNSAYGNHYIAVRTNATARPGCAPWQGKIIDMSGSGGRVPDENGVMLEAYPVGVTTYGQPAGIFGINCHHVPPIPFVPGYSGMRYEPNDTEDNAERYKLTQTQRRLERDVRNAKREQAMLEAAGDEEGAKLAAQKVRQKQQRVKDLVDSNPDVLIRRYENEWVKTYNDKRGGVWYNGGGGGKARRSGTRGGIPLNISSPIEQRNTGKGSPSAISVIGRPLNNRQKALLASLPDYNSKVIVGKNNVNAKDLAALTAETGVEFALFTKQSERMIIRGASDMTDVSISLAKQMANEGWRWSAHTHPGYTEFCMIASDGDIAILEAFGQKRSLILNSMGARTVFSLEE